MVSIFFAVKHHRSSSLTCSPPRSNLSVIDKDISGTKSSQGSPLNLRKHVMLNNLQNVDSVDHSDVDFFNRRLGMITFELDRLVTYPYVKLGFGLGGSP